MSSGSNSTDLLTEECYEVQAVTCELMAVVSNLPVTCYHLKKKKKKVNDSKVQYTFTIIYTIANVKFIYFKFLFFNLYYHL